MQNGETGFVAVVMAIAIIVGAMFLSMGMRNGLARSAAIHAGMTGQQYSDWVDDVR